MSEKTYLINGRSYVQRPLVLGQLLPLCKMLETVEIRSFSVQGIVSAFGQSLSTALAVLLIPKGDTVRGRDLETIAAELDEHMSAETALEVVADFLSFNPASSILEKVKEITGAFQKNLSAIAAVHPERSSESESLSNASSTTLPTAT